ncbi:MAG: hypothetical protein MH252_18360 [Thermosynechococcaceae cyanobacterium MS004]|nr:hypothetical protein [Thermosynechococcaceae cyanobacterium MS004]
MTLIHNSLDWQELCQQTSASNMPLDLTEWVQDIPTCLGRGYTQGIDILLPGVWLEWRARTAITAGLILDDLEKYLVNTPWRYP